MDDAQCLALLAAKYEATNRFGPIRSQELALDTLVWARTDGLAEVYRRTAAAVAPTATTEPERDNESKTPAEGGAHPDGPMCEACEGKGQRWYWSAIRDRFSLPCASCDGKGWRPPTYEEEHITSPSGLPRTGGNP